MSREEKFVKFRESKRIYYIRPAELPVFVGVSLDDEEWYQRGFGGEVYLGQNEAEAFENFNENMDIEEDAFLRMVEALT